MTSQGDASFEAGQETGTRLSACLARLAALQLVEESRWWNRWRHRIMARALLSCADELDEDADARRAEGAPGVDLPHLERVALEARRRRIRLP